MSMINFLIIALSLPLAEARSPPALGTYRFVKPFTVEGCAKFEGGRGSVNRCIKTISETFQANRLIPVDEFFWDDSTKEFGAKIVFFGQNRSVPITYLEKVEIPKSHCQELESQYRKHISDIGKSCNAASDCVVTDLAWDPCDIPMAANKGALESSDLRTLKELRAITLQNCGTPPKPCPAIVTRSICDRGRCNTVEEFFLKNPVLRLQLLDAKTKKPLTHKAVTVLSGNIIYCVTTPCPEGRQIYSLKTDANGYLDIKREYLNGKISIRLPEDGKSPARGVEELQMEALLSWPHHQLNF